MINIYNLSNLEPKFKIYLAAENISDISLRNYLSDIRHFIGWTISKNKSAVINSKLIEDYKTSHLTSGLPIKTINRRLSAIRKFFEFVERENLLDHNPAKKVSNISLVNKNKESGREPKKKLINPLNFTPFPSSPIVGGVLEQNRNLYSKKKNVFIYFLTIIMIGSAFCIGLILLLNKIQTKQSGLPVMTKQLTSPNRLIAFNARLTDKLGNPLTSKTDMVFRLYNQPEGGKILYSASCVGQNGAVKPDADGNLKIIIGSDCEGKALASDIFANNPDVYLGITVGSDSESKPRQQIPNLGYALNSDTVQGLSLGSRTTSVPYINQNGDLLIAADNPGIRSTSESSNFTISSAENLTLQSAQEGDVVLQATDSGQIKLRTGGFSDSYTRLAIDELGNVGIGTLFPDYKLEVAGDVKIADGNKLVLSSSSTDPVGTNGSMYYNSVTNKFRCYQNNLWTDCLTLSGNNGIGGVDFIYSGRNLNQIGDVMENVVDVTVNSLSSALLKAKDIFTENLAVVNNLTSANFSAITGKINTLTSEVVSSSQKIVSPIVESDNIYSNYLLTQEIKPKNNSLVLDLSGISPTPESFTESSKNASPSGPLASVIIRGLAGKTVAEIDAEGNASFNGRVLADSLKINHDATIAGSLDVGTVNSENISQLTSEISDSQLNIASNSSNLQQLTSNLNNIQSLLAEIKNQPLSKAEYSQSLDYAELNSLTIGQLTSTGNSNLYNLAVTGSTTFGNLFIQDNSIKSLAWDLNLSALSTIKLFDSSVVISKEGNIVTQGSIVAQKGLKTDRIEPLNNNERVNITNLTTNNLALENKYLQATSAAAVIAEAENFKQNGISTPALQTNTAMAGNGVIPAGHSEIMIYNNEVRDGSLIYLTPESAASVNLSVSQKEACSKNNPDLSQCQPFFKVSSSSVQPSAINFNWLILN